MKVFGLLFFLILAILFTLAVAFDEELDPDVEACKEECLKYPNSPVCGAAIGRATYFNECAMKCEKAELVHQGACGYDDLLKNHIHQ